MAEAATVQVVGLKELSKAVKQMDPAARKAIRSAVKEAALDVAATAKQRAPKLSGRLAASIRAGATQSGSYVQAGSGSVQYAGPINFGWARHNIRSQEFMYSALAERADALGSIFEEEIEKALAQVFGE